jgi:hypothetical protein
VKRKIGPLPLWAWVLIAGGTVGIVWYLRAKPTAPDTAGDGSLPATSGAPGSGGVDSTGSDLASPPPFTGSATTDDILAALSGISGQLATLPGGQGLTDGGSDSPVMTWSGELSDVATGITNLHEAFPFLFATPSTAAAAAPKASAGTVNRPSAAHGGALWTFRRSSSGRLIPLAPAPKGAKATAGSGKAANTEHDTSPVRRTVTHVADRAGGAASPTGGTPKVVVKNGKVYHFYVRPASHH